MKRTSLLYAVALTCLIASPAVAQSLRDIVTETEGGRMPSQAEWQQRGPAASENGPTEAATPNAEPVAAEPGPPAFSPEPTTPGPTVCVPPGMPALTELVSVGHQVMVAPVDGSDETVMVNAIGLITREHLAKHRGGDLSLDFIVYYVRGHLAAVDDHPGDPSEPDIVDIGMVSPRGTALAQGTPVCRWVRLARPAGDGRVATPGSRI